MLGKIILVLAALAWANAQVPNFGFCPEYVPMANFDMKRFMGVWYETERYFQLSEVVSRCVMTNYTRGPDGKYRVSNQVTNRFTGIKRILDGEIKPAASKAEEGKLHVKYTTIPLTPEAKYSVLETDYDSYAVLWNCQGIGPIHTQNVWIMTRDRIPSGEVLQKAYGVLDKYKIPKTFFVKTDQADCAYFDEPAAQKPTEKPTRQKVSEKESQKSAVAPEDAEEAKEEMKNETPDEKTPAATADIPKIIAEPLVAASAETVPERILKIAETIKGESGDNEDKIEFHSHHHQEETRAVEGVKSEKVEQAEKTEKTADIV